MTRSTARTILIALGLAGVLAACDTMGDNSAATTGSSQNTSATAPSSSGSSTSSGNTSSGTYP
jgi:hypothetical protein